MRAMHEIAGERTRLACWFLRPRRNHLSHRFSPIQKSSRLRGRNRQHARARAIPE